MGACPPRMAWATCYRCGRPGCPGDCPADSLSGVAGCGSCGLGAVGLGPMPIGLGMVGQATTGTGEGIPAMTEQQRAIVCEQAKRFGRGYAVEGKYADAEGAWNSMFDLAAQSLPADMLPRLEALKNHPEVAKIKACFVAGFDEQKGSFYSQPAGKKGLMWGAIGGLVVGGVVTWLIVR